jgi:hypothetical protein
VTSAACKILQCTLHCKQLPTPTMHINKTYYPANIAKDNTCLQHQPLRAGLPAARQTSCNKGYFEKCQNLYFVAPLACTPQSTNLQQNKHTASHWAAGASVQQMLQCSLCGTDSSATARHGGNLTNATFGQPPPHPQNTLTAADTHTIAQPLVKGSAHCHHICIETPRCDPNPTQ